MKLKYVIVESSIELRLSLYELDLEISTTKMRL